MYNPDQEEIKNFIFKRIMSQGDDFEVLKALIMIAAPAQKILKVKSYEKMTFHPKKNGVKPLDDVLIERLSLVHPPSFECALRLKINGYFKIKYKSSAIPLPMPVEPFDAIYIGIIVQSEPVFTIRNERIILPENLILQ
jgi:hypothetical protein